MPYFVCPFVILVEGHLDHFHHYAIVNNADIEAGKDKNLPWDIRS
jgi:hypothetical protein